MKRYAQRGWLLLALVSTSGCGRATHDPDVADSGAAVDAGCVDGTTGSTRTFPDSGPCDDSEPQRVSPAGQTLGHYSVTCESQALDQPGCQGLPNDLWGRCALRRCAGEVRYAERCIAYLPHQNPYYPGPPQACTCMPFPDKTKLTWLCGL